ncbi:MAG: YgiT-type zinc finger protein [Anaerolineae bacterium]
MCAEKKTERLEERKVTYTLLKEGKLYVVENVPARVNVETGEQYFSPEAVERLQHIIRHQEPARTVQTPVFDFA